jgi:DNA invertase Pin-like site-specific DNA recombinase
VAVVGYARVSTRDQHPEAQTDALAAAGCEKTFTEHASGTLARRPALDEALSYLRAGDTLVVTKLDRLGRSVRNLKQMAGSVGRCNTPY